jgi:hypothetical protein
LSGQERIGWLGGCLVATQCEVGMTPKPGERGPNRYPDDSYLRVAEENDARLQPDPELALSSGRASSAQIWTVALAVIAIAGLVLYGLNQSPQNSQTAASPPSAATTTGAAPSSEGPPASGQQQNPQDKAAPEQPAQEPGKQGPSDSAR